VVPKALAESVALLLLAATLVFAVVRPRGLPEAVVAIPAALLTVVLGIVPSTAALEELRSLAPTIGFLAAVLVLAELCDREGLFEAAGRRMAAGARGRPVALLGLVFVAGSAITAVLSLDATVVLLTPVVFATAAAWPPPRSPRATRAPCTSWATRRSAWPTSTSTSRAATRGRPPRTATTAPSRWSRTSPPPPRSAR
jgi:arsenical pump membrane protein